MSWRVKLQQASFRNVKFQVEVDDLSAGRRIQVHEYPQRDKPFTEDLGKATREIALTGFVIGDNYIAERDALLAAIEDAGPGTLIHPWYGSLQVVVKECRVSHSNREGGMARFSLTFVEAGELAYPKAGAATGSGVRLSSDSFLSTLSSQFSQTFSIDGAPDWSIASSVSSLTRGLYMFQSFAAKGRGLVVNPSSIIGNVDGLFGNPLALANSVISMFSEFANAGVTETPTNFYVSTPPASQTAFAAVNQSTGVVSVEKALTGNFNTLTGYIASMPRTVSGYGTTPARQQQSTNNAALEALMRGAALGNAAAVSSLMPLPVYDDAQLRRDTLTAALDAESMTASDAMFTSLTDLRTKVHQDMTERGKGAARMRTVKMPEVRPSLVVAYDLYEDAGRESEIVDRNKVKHPLFVPAEPIKVLSR